MAISTVMTGLTSVKSTIVRSDYEERNPSSESVERILPRSKWSLEDLPSFFAPKKSTTVRSLLKCTGSFALRAACRVAPNQVARWADRTMLRTRRHAQPARERTLLADAEPFNFVSGGTRLAAWYWGEGGDKDSPIVILTHGWLGRSGQMAAFAEPLVQAGFQVVAFDALGHGVSPGASSSFPELRDAIEDLAFALKARRLGRPYAVIAHSAGTVAAGWAARRGLEIERLVLVAPPADPVEWLHREASAAGLSYDVTMRMRRRIEQRFNMSWEELRSVVHAPRMKQAALIVHDRGDRIVPFAEGAAVAASWPGATLHISEGLGHHRILRDPVVIQAAVEHLVAGLPQMARARAVEGPLAEAA